ncbi:MAG: zinc-binding dehydrogenase [Gaiellaceae bacterium]
MDARLEAGANRRDRLAPARRETLDRLIAPAGLEKLGPVIDRELPLAGAAEAHPATTARETFGKVILRP